MFIFLEKSRGVSKAAVSLHIKAIVQKTQAICLELQEIIRKIYEDESAEK